MSTFQHLLPLVPYTDNTFVSRLLVIHQPDGTVYDEISDFQRNVSYSDTLGLVWTVGKVSECMGFNIPFVSEMTYYVLSDSTNNRSFETCLSRQLIALLLTTKNKETKHHIHPNTKEKQKKVP